MKTKFSFKYLLVLLVFAMALMVAMPYKYVVSAESTDVEHNTLVVAEEPTPNPGPTPPADLGGAVPNDESGINDSQLYRYLITCYNSYYGFTKDDEGYAKQIYTEMFKDIEVLDLSIAHGSIKSLEGLQNLNLENLKVLKANNNQISEISVDDLKYLLSLEELILFDNTITELTIPSSLVNLRVLNLNNNEISKIDISNINEGKVYLSFNKFTSIKDITFPRVIYNTDLDVELFNNNITDADEMYLAGFDVDAGIRLELGLQGIGLNYKRRIALSDREITVLPKDVAFKFYSSTLYPNIQVKFYNYITNELVTTITNDSENKIKEHYLNIGEYKVDYFIDENATTHMFNNDDPLMVAFKDFEYFKVIPSAPSVKFIVKGKEYDTYGKLNGKATLKATNPDSIGEIYYSIGGTKWIKGDEVELNHGGQYSVMFKVVVGELDATDAFESEVESKYVQQSLNPVIPDVVMLLIIAAIAIVLFAVVLPLLGKYINKR